METIENQADTFDRKGEVEGKASKIEAQLDGTMDQ